MKLKDIRHYSQYIPLPYQQDIMKKIEFMLKTYVEMEDLLFELPTGGGKTYIAYLIMLLLIDRGKISRNSFVLILVPNLLLLEQNKELAYNIAMINNPKDWNEDVLAIGSGKGNLPFNKAINKIKTKRVAIATNKLSESNGIDKMIDYFNSDYFKETHGNVVVLIDESHRAEANKMGTFLRKIKQLPHSFLIGISATPELRSDGKKLTQELFNHYHIGTTLKELINNGFLKSLYVIQNEEAIKGIDKLANASNKNKVFKGLDEEKDKLIDKLENETNKRIIRQESADLSKYPTLSTMFSQPEFLDTVIKTMETEPELKKTIDNGGIGLVFCSNIEQAKATVEHFKSKGYRIEALYNNVTVTIDGRLIKGDNAKNYLLNQLRKGEIQMLVSVDMLFEGVDIQHLSFAIILRYTTSAIIARQMIGRVIRKYEGIEKAIFLDIVGLISKFIRNDISTEVAQPNNINKDAPATGIRKNLRVKTEIASFNLKTLEEMKQDKDFLDELCISKKEDSDKIYLYLNKATDGKLENLGGDISIVRDVIEKYFAKAIDEMYPSTAEGLKSINKIYNDSERLYKEAFSKEDYLKIFFNQSIDLHYRNLSYTSLQHFLKGIYNNIHILELDKKIDKRFMVDSLLYNYETTLSEEKLRDFKIFKEGYKKWYREKEKKIS